MQPISLKDKKKLEKMKQICARCGASPVEFHHVFIYAGSQIPDWFNIVFACKKCHQEATPHNNKYKMQVREFFEHLVLKNYLGYLIALYPKKEWLQLAKYLDKKYAS